MNKTIIHIGIIGSGFAARFHFDALKRVFSATIKVEGAYSKSPDELTEFTATRNIRQFGSLVELLAVCDVVHICTPPVTHEPIAVLALNQNKHVIVEKPFTGYFGDGSSEFNGDTFSREKGYQMAIASINRMLEAESKSTGKIMYAENWVYAPAIQKEREVIEKQALKFYGYKPSRHTPDLIRRTTANGVCRVGDRSWAKAHIPWLQPFT
jgi:predicted dehydrogenase